MRRAPIALALAGLALLGAAGALAAGQGAPQPPASITATPLADGVLVSFGASGSSGTTGTSGTSGTSGATGPTTATGPSGSYMVTVAPIGKQVFGTSSPITAGGLQPNTSYRFRVTASSAAGSGLSSAPSAPVTTLAPPAGTVPPALSGLKVSLISFFAATSGGPLTPGKGAGTTLTYTDSAAATLTINVIRVNNGYKRAGACLTHVAPTGKRCTSYHLLGTVTKTDTAGANSLHFSGRLGGRALTGGVYQLRLTATANGLTGNTLKVPIDVF